MSLKRMVLQMGQGTDIHGADSTKAAERAVRDADIVTSATMSTDPLIKGDWFQPGQHIDLIGAYRPDMREVDDEALRRARVFVDSFETTVGHIGEIKIPLETGAITRDHLVADYYDEARFQRETVEEITLFKNGGGAHLAELPEAPLTFRHVARPGQSGEVSGHYHPKIRLALKGQTISRPAFLIDSDRVILPAYGTYTGGLSCDDPALTGLMRAEAVAVLTGPAAHALPMRARR